MLPLEDQATDVLAKAQRGLGLSDADLADLAGVTPADLKALKAGEPVDDEAALARVADALNLDAPALADLAAGTWQPAVSHGPTTFETITTPFGGDMSVNAYLVWDREGGTAVLFDTGTDAAPIREALRAHDLTLEAIFLTHTHGDHIEALGNLRELGCDVFVPERERGAVPTAVPAMEGQHWSLGELKIEARLTRGHTVGGLTYVVELANTPPMLAIVGDALFSASQGGMSAASYAEALQLNRDHILSLPEDTILCPGHGPLSTVGQERRHNPFYARS